MTNPIFAQYNVRVPMRDGVTLSADIFRPTASRSGERFAVILVRTPYNKNNKLYIEAARDFAERGYVYVTMDVRGRGDSDGDFVPYRNDGPDGYDAIEWCAAQSWSTGAIGTLGASYLGRIQWLAALEKPPHLKTMIVMVTPADPFVESPTGTNNLAHICWLYLVNGRLRQPMEEVDWNPIYEHLPLCELDQRAGFESKQWQEELQHPTRDSYWDKIRYQHRFHEIDLPVMHISGWYDDEQISTPMNFIGMTKRGASEFARRNQKLLMGPWGHAINTTQKMGEVDFGPDSLIDLRGYELRWFDALLKGEETGILQEPPARLFVMGENKWRDENEFPLARTQFTHYYFQSGGSANSRFGDGTLSTKKPTTETPDHYVYDPACPTPYVTAPTSSQIGGPDDYAAVQQRGDVLVYMTPPLENDVTVIGPIRVELYASSSAVDTDFTALFFDAHPTGFIQCLSDGIVRARYRDGMEKTSLIEPNKIFKFEIDVWNTSQVFFKGHRIGIQIASAAFPKFDRNLNTGEPLATGTRMAQAQQTIYHDAGHPSALVLPIIPSE